jgi:hypothetical protein
LRLTLPDDRLALLKLVGFLPIGHLATAIFRLLPWYATHLPTANELQTISEQWVLLDDHHEFSILFDGRRKLTSLLDPIGVVLVSETQIDVDQWRAYGPQALLPMTVSALAALTGVP